MLLQLLGQISSYQAEITDRQETFKDDIIKRWQESKKIPRKKKKQERRRLRILWNIANYDPFDSRWWYAPKPKKRVVVVNKN